MKKHVDLNFCIDCYYRSTEKLISKSGKEYEVAKCNINDRQLKLQSSCPNNYNQLEYNSLIKKCEEYDELRYSMELCKAN